MDRWIIKQLRGQILCDLEASIPIGYFDQEKESFKLSNLFPSHQYLSEELSWGYNAAKLGHEIYFNNKDIRSPRLVSAAEVLMNLGMLAASDANKTACKYLSDQAKAKNLNDCNATAVYEQISQEHIPTFEQNIKEALKQYLKFLSAEEAKPFVSLVEAEEDKEKMSSKKNEEIEKEVNNTTHFVLNVNAPVKGNIQQGTENRIEAKPKHFKKKVLSQILVGAIYTVIGGIILYYLIEYIKNIP